MSDGVSGISGGGSMSMIGGIVGTFIGGPVGGMIGSAAGSLLQECVGEATSDASTQLEREDGMPSFIADQVKEAVEKVMHELLPDGISPADREQAKGEFGDAISEFGRDLAQKIVDAVRQELGLGAGAASAGAASGTASGAAAGAAGESATKGDAASGGNGAEATSSAGQGSTPQGEISGESWLMAIAKAMGSMMGQKAADMVRLSKQMQSEQAQGAHGGTAGAEGTSGNAGAAGTAETADTAGTSATAGKAATPQEKGADASQKTSAQLQATTQEFKMLQEAFSTVVKGLGEAVAALVKK
jgi:hypothetical protein